MANMVEGGRTPLVRAPELERLGYRMVIFPNSLVRLFARQGTILLEALRMGGATDAVRAGMLSFDELNDLLGTDSILKAGQEFAAKGR